MALEPTRRSIITGLIALVAAPAIVRAGSLMPVKVMASDADCQAILDAIWNEQKFKLGGAVLDNRMFWIDGEGDLHIVPVDALTR